MVDDVKVRLFMVRALSVVLQALLRDVVRSSVSKSFIC